MAGVGKIREVAALACGLALLLPSTWADAGALPAEPVSATAVVATGGKEAVSAVLARLEKGVAGIATLRTAFTEEKKLAAFRNPVILKGHICLMKPGKVAWHVDEPMRYSVVITDKSIRQWDAETGKIVELKIDRIPVMRTALDQMRVWFSGSYSSLQTDYVVRVVSENPVELEFVPRESNFVRKFIRGVSVGFREDERYLKWIRITEIGGDTSMMSFDATELNPKLDPRDFEVK